MASDSIRSAAADPKSNAELTLRGLRVFVAVEETGTVAGAARRLGGSPSGVSQRITALERAVGAKLFDRRTRPITLTPAGMLLRTHAGRILEAVGEAQSELAELGLADLPRLRLSIIDDLDASLTPALVGNLRRRFRNCFVSSFSGRSDAVTAQLESRDADIAVTAIPPDDPGSFRILPILREPFVLVSAKGALTAGDDIREQLQKLPFVQYSEAMPMGRLIAQHFRRVKIDPPRRYAFDASRSVFAMIAEAGGWTLTTPLSILDTERFLPRLDLMPMPFPTLSRRIYLTARIDELGSLPDRLAADCRALVAERLIPRFAAIAPWGATAIEIIED